ncbi:hypothetical protein DL765_001279 [Monosporascus sp. GIB2]|nr:hypothetical protein DL765_001279 [Monosporascus sp. GIB2]
MDSQDTVVKRFAILIGINAYLERPLKACVSDVKRIKAYLDGLRPRVDVTILTATRSDIDLEPSDPTEDLVRWPTHKNVIAAIDSVNSTAKAGDLVYIHFSGHGTREEPVREFSNQSTGDLALVLLDEAKRRAVKYLWGHKLALSLKAMVDKKVVVTLVLDCCFSATVYRNDDPEVRFLPYDPAVGSERITESQSLVATGDDTSRDVSMLPNWMINPDGYAILSACGPHEEAREPKFDGENHGALSYFLLRALDSVSAAAKHKDVHDYIRANFKKCKIPQSPVLYGNKGQAFFAPPESGAITVTVPVIEKGGGLQVQAGVAHGVGNGDQFLLYPLGSTDLRLGSQQDSIIAHVTNTGAFASSLKLSQPTSIHIKTGWIARPLTRSSLQRFPVRLDSTLPNQEEWLALLRERSLTMATDSQFSFHIVLKGVNECEILDEQGKKIPNTPIIAVYNRAEFSYVCDLVEHLARFRAVEALSNSGRDDLSSPFRQSFKIHMSHISSGGQVTIDPGDLVEVENGERVRLILENKGSQVLYLFIYSMSSGWQIENVLRGTYDPIPPMNAGPGFGGKYDKGLKFTVPKKLKEKGCTQCEDTLKVFVTSRPTSFDMLELPELGGAPKKPGIGGGRESDDDMPGDWEAFNFRVRTSLRQG